jgi:hypothetical protein
MLHQEQPSFVIVGYIIKLQAILLITIMNNKGEVRHQFPVKKLI